MTTARFRKQLVAGVWHDNPGLVQLLGLCPMLAVTTTFVNGLGLGLATLLVLTLSNGIVSAARRWLRREIRIPLYVMVIASLVTSVELLFKAFLPSLDRSLGIFIPLIVTNCAIVARAEVFASRNRVLPSLVDGISMGAGFALLLAAIGAFRELIGYGTLLSGLDLLTTASSFQAQGPAESGLLLAILPPGAFISLALAIAAKNALELRLRRQAQTQADAVTSRSTSGLSS